MVLDAKKKRRREKENQIRPVLFNPRQNRISPVHFSNSFDKQSTHRPHFDNTKPQTHKESLPRARYSFVVAKDFTGCLSVSLVESSLWLSPERRKTRTRARNAQSERKKSHFEGGKFMKFQTRLRDEQAPFLTGLPVCLFTRYFSLERSA